jgi:hypothetical protein
LLVRALGFGLPLGLLGALLSPAAALADERHAGVHASAVASTTGLAPDEDLAGPTKFHPLSPARILDTRTGVGTPAVKPAAGTTVVFAPAGAGGVPAIGATAVVLNVTITDASGVGFVQVFPTGQAVIGSSSNPNVERVGETIPSLVVAPIGDGGQVSIYTQGGGHLLADVFGWFGPSPATVDGRYLSLAGPRRVLDTRDPNLVPVPNPGDVANCGDFATWDAANRWFWTYHRYGDPGRLDGVGNGVPCESLPGVSATPLMPVDLFKPTAGATVTLPLGGGSGGIPAGATAVVANVTATEATAAGFVTIVPTGAPIGQSSNLNVEAAGQTVANLAVVPLAADGSVTL